MTFGFGFGFPRRVGAGGFSPASLFAAGEVGAWYDPSDLTTLFQDTAGTTPITTPGQVVALMLDKSRGLVPGPQLVTNGDFSNGSTGWTLISSSVVNGALDCSAATSLTFATRAITVTAGRTYLVSFTVTNYISGSIFLTLGVGANVSTAAFSANGVSTSFLVAGVGNAEIRMGCAGSGFVGTIDNISVRELPGNHATQATTASRPTYGIVPATGRRNLLLRSQSFVSPWSIATGSITATNLTAPDGTSTGSTLTASGGNTRALQTVSGQTPNATYTFSAWVKSSSSGGASNVRLTTNDSFSWNTGQSQRFALTADWQRLVLTGALSTGPAILVNIGSIDVAGNNDALCAGNIDIWGAQLETGSTATAYQRVTTQWDVTQAGVQNLPYLGFDGVDDGMTTASFSWPGLYSAWAGVRPGRVTGVQILATMDGGAGIERLPQFLRLNTSNPESIGFVAGSPFSDQGPAVAANTSYVLSANTLSSQINVRTNAVANAATSFTGSLNTASRALTIGMFDLAFPGSYFLGNLYGLIVRGAATDAANITSTETWVNGKTGAF